MTRIILKSILSRERGIISMYQQKEVGKRELYNYIKYIAYSQGIQRQFMCSD